VVKHVLPALGQLSRVTLEACLGINIRPEFRMSAGATTAGSALTWFAVSGVLNVVQFLRQLIIKRSSPSSSSVELLFSLQRGHLTRSTSGADMRGHVLLNRRFRRMVN